MSKAVRDLMEDDNLCLQEGLRSQQHFDCDDTVGSVVDRFEEVFTELMARK